jgi:hypothetical protein
VANTADGSGGPMKIIASIPTQKVQGNGWFTFESSQIEVEVVRVLRYRADSYRKRYCYMADIKAPAEIHPEAIGLKDGIYRVNIIRKANPKWKPPQFPEGKNNVEVG